MNALSALKAPLMGALLGLCALRAVAGQAAPAAPVPSQHGELSTIASLDVPRYMGTWFEIAKYPNWFQKKCTGGGTTAQYRQQADGTVQVINRCRLESGAMNEAMATARQVGSATSPKLKVRFAPAWLSFLPFVWGDYWVIDHDEAYQLVAVSEPSQEYLWVLARTPQVDPTAYNALLTRLTQKGFDVSKLELTRQD